MPFADIVSDARQTAIRRLAVRAHLFQHVHRHARTALARRIAERRASAACSRLLAMRAAQVAEIFPARGIVTIVLPDHHYVNVPVTYLEPAARRIVALAIEQCLAIHCSN